MMTLDLNGIWTMNKVGSTKAYQANVPTTMYQVLLENDEISDPFIGENDRVLTQVSDDEYEFQRTFEVDASLLNQELVEITFYGLDTLATVWVNGSKILRADNMHRTHVVSIKDFIEIGTNKILIRFDSPTKYIAKENAKAPIWGVDNPMDGYEYLRKAHHMFGWDWGPQLPDMGIWRDVEINAYSTGRIDDYYVTQKHSEAKVELEIDVDCTLYSDKEVEVKVVLKDADSTVVAEQASVAKAKNALCLDVNDPKLWWPNGYGEQPLYTVEVQLLCEGEVLQTIDKRIGLRTMTMTREADQWGESFDMTVNGVRIFAMGADYIPEDVLICRMSQERTRILLEDCAKANFNHMRVWGGAFYPGDDFYDICDELGLLVWQDFMFACGVYRLTKKFEENITAEFIDNIKRIRHHACMGLWCGNNEMEWGFVEWEIPKEENLRLDYLRMYERLIPDVLEAYDPNTFYWPASPSSGGGFDNPNGDDKGDVHYWEVFHGNKHYKTFRQHYFRFASEFGMQSFPEMKTIEAFSEVDEREIYAPVMENHNKCLGEINGNMKIMMNMATEFNLPNNLEDVVYLSQVFQGETIRCAVEHMRRNRGRCMGSTYWQVNDNWPVASWASIDVHGRWKALHYMVKRFYAPIHVTAHEEGFKGFIHVCNERMTDFKGALKWQIRHVENGIVEEHTEVVEASKLSAGLFATADISVYCKAYADERNYYLSYQLIEDNGDVHCGDVMLFVNHKYFNFNAADISLDVVNSDGDLEIHVSSDTMAKSVGIETKDVDVVLSDNYFDLIPGQTKVIKVDSFRSDVVIGQQAEVLSEEDLKGTITLRAVNTLTYL